MKKALLFGLLAATVSFNAYAEDAADKDKYGWRLNFRRVALDVTSTEVKNADKYQDSPVTSLSSDSETIIKGVFDGVLEYEQPKYQWNNSLFMEYGKKTIKKADGEKTRNENADEILFTSDYTRKVWKYKEADVGPFGSLGYQTEFTDNEDSPRMKVLRGKGGIKLFNGKYIKELYVAGVGEHDMTYSDEVNKFAAEIGTRMEYPLREGVKFQLEGYYRDYISYSEYIGTDLKYDLNVTGRMDVKLFDSISLAPFASYRMAESREAGEVGSNFTIGLSLTYSDLFNLSK